MSDIAQHVRTMRRRTGLSQERFAELCGLTRIQIFDLENGRNKGSTMLIRKGLAAGAQMTLDQLNAFLSQPAPPEGRKPFRANGKAA